MAERFANRFDRDPSADPMAVMGNLVDVMLVFACGLIAALIVRSPELVDALQPTPRGHPGPSCRRCQTRQARGLRPPERGHLPRPRDEADRRGDAVSALAFWTLLALAARTSDPHGTAPRGDRHRCRRRAPRRCHGRHGHLCGRDRHRGRRAPACQQRRVHRRGQRPWHHGAAPRRAGRLVRRQHPRQHAPPGTSGAGRRRSPTARAPSTSPMPLFAFERVGSSAESSAGAGRKPHRGRGPPRTGDGRMGTSAAVSHGSLDTSGDGHDPTRRARLAGSVDVLAVADLFATRGASPTTATTAPSTRASTTGCPPGTTTTSDSSTPTCSCAWDRATPA